MRETLITLYNTLCRISVSGKDNLDHLLGCLQVLQRLIEQESVPAAETEPEEEAKDEEVEDDGR